MKILTKKVIAFFVGLVVWSGLMPCYATQTDPTTAYTNAYIYAYPLVLMQVTKQAMTNVSQPEVSAGKGRAPINQFVHLQSFPSPSFKDVIRPNADTLYSSAWLDVSKEPMVLSVPDTQGRYYVLQMLDAWTNVFAAPGKRTTGTKAQNFVVVGPNWQGQPPKGMRLIKAPTNMVWILGRTQTNGPEDYKNVNQLQAHYKLTPLSAWNTAYMPPTNLPIDTTLASAPPVEQVANMDAVTFLKTFASALKQNPPSRKDAEMLAQLKTINVIPGEDFDATKLTPEQIQQITAAFKQAQNTIAAAENNVVKTINGWQIMRDNIGAYGTHYLTRAYVANQGLGANLPEDAIYPGTAVDSEGQSLTGSQRYILHFAKGQLPPVNAFWSVTLYSPEGFFVENPLQRYTLGDRSQLEPNADGSLDIFIQHDRPGKDQEANWLPAPAGPFNLLMRLYWPKPAALEGKWTPLAVRRAP